jgi:hypothetical protein
MRPSRQNAPDPENSKLRAKSTFFIKNQLFRMKRLAAMAPDCKSCRQVRLWLRADRSGNLRLSGNRPCKENRHLCDRTRSVGRCGTKSADQNPFGSRLPQSDRPVLTGALNCKLCRQVQRPDTGRCTCLCTTRTTAAGASAMRAGAPEGVLARSARHDADLRRRMAAKPTSAVPSRASDAGSGSGGVVSTSDCTKMALDPTPKAAPISCHRPVSCSEP